MRNERSFLLVVRGSGERRTRLCGVRHSPCQLHDSFSLHSLVVSHNNNRSRAGIMWMSSLALYAARLCVGGQSYHLIQGISHRYRLCLLFPQPDVSMLPWPKFQAGRHGLDNSFANLAITQCACAVHSHCVILSRVRCCHSMQWKREKKRKMNPPICWRACRVYVKHRRTSWIRR